MKMSREDIYELFMRYLVTMPGSRCGGLSVIILFLLLQKRIAKFSPYSLGGLECRDRVGKVAAGHHKTWKAKENVQYLLSRKCEEKYIQTIMEDIEQNQIILICN